jgi:hypothetical protein
MNESINEFQGEIARLLDEVVAQLGSGRKVDTRRAVAKLERIVALASTLALTIQARH